MALEMTKRERADMKASRRYWGRDYDGLKAWTDKTAKLREKKPPFIARLTKLASDTVSNYLFGEGKSPQFSLANPPVFQAGDEDASDPASDLHQDSGLEELQLEIARMANLHGRAAVGFHMNQGTGGPLYDVEILQTSLSRVTLGRDDRAQAVEKGVDFDDVLQLQEVWRSVAVVDGKDTKMLNMRLWTTESTTTYEPIDEENVDSLDDLLMKARVNAVAEHALGFCPVEWIPNSGFVANDDEGVPLVGEAEFHLEDEYNYTISQADRAVMYNQEPIVAFKNVSNVAADDTTQRGAGKTLLLTGDGTGKEPSAEILELEGEGQRVAMELAKEIRNQFFQVCQIVVHDPDTFSGAMSGVALERLLMPTTALVNNYRKAHGKRLSRLISKMLKAGGMKENTDVKVTWGQLIQPSLSEVNSAVIAAGSALDMGLIDDDVAVRFLAPFFGVQNAGDLLQRLRSLGTNRNPDDENTNQEP